MVNLKKNFQDVLEFTNNKVCLVRVDLDMPIINGKISDFTRMEKIIPTLKQLIARNSKLVLLSHLGRPGGKIDNSLSLSKVLPHLEKNIGKTILFSNDNIMSPKVEKEIKKLEPGSVLLLENMRFYKEEENNDLNFSKKIASYADIFLNESFATCHRNHASITGIATFLPSFPGKIFEYELKNLNSIIKNFETTMSIAILGGSKVSSKIGIIENLLKKFNKLLIGGAMANTFLYAKGLNIGKSFCEPKMSSNAKEILRKFNDRIILPNDVIVVDSEDSEENFSIDINNVKNNQIIYDIGPKTRKDFYNEIIKSKKLLWNGPLGFFEKKPFDNGTNFVSGSVKTLNKNRFFSVAGGGDTISALKNAQTIEHFSFISTGGGAFLEFIEGKSLPGIEILNK